MSTMKEVADFAGVSVATVSRVVNQSGYVRVALQEKVKDAMRELRYHPSALARSLRRQETLSIALLLPQLDQPFFSRIAHLIVQALFKHKYRTLVCLSDDETQESDYINIMVRQRVDGVIIVPIDRGPALHILAEQQTPTVLLDRDVPTFQSDKVFINNQRGGYLAICHLLELGHRNIAILGKDDIAAPIRQRIAGAQDALAEYNLTAPVLLEHIDGEADPYTAGYIIAKKLLGNVHGRPTAIFALTDGAAVGVMRAAAESGLRVPDDLSVIGFDDIPLARQCIPALTTIAQPTDEVGALAASMLLAALGKEKRKPVTKMLDTWLVARESTAPLSRI